MTEPIDYNLLNWVLQAVQAGVVVICVCAVASLAAALRSYPQSASRSDRRALKFYVSMPVEEVMRAAARFAFQANYTIGYYDEPQGCIVMASRETLLDWGYFYPVVAREEEGQTLVEVRVLGRISGRMGIVTSARHQECFYGLKAFMACQSTGVRN